MEFFYDTKIIIQNSIAVVYFNCYILIFMNLISKIRFTPSRSMPDLSSIDLYVILRATYYKFVTLLCIPIKCYMVTLRQRLIEIYQEIAVRIKQIVTNKNRNNAFLYS